MTSLTSRMAAMMSWSCRRSATSTTKLLIPRRSSVTVTSAFVMLPLRAEMAPVISERSPGRSLPMYTAMRTGRLPGSSTSHSTSINRSRSRTLLATVRQSRACTVSPRPRVMKPTIGSPGSGLQHRANRTSRSSTPRIRTPSAVLGRVAAEQGRRIQVVLPRLALEHLAAQLDRAGALLDLEPLVDLRPGARGLDDLQPVAARVLVRGGDDLDDVALPQGVAERDELAVH